MKFRLTHTVLILLFLLSGADSAWAASTYGSGSYGTQPYSLSTPVPTTSAQPTPLPTASPAPPTIITTPSGLDFAVNLSNGQIIPPPSYTVTVTPLNGQGKTVAKVDFLVDGQPAFTTTPDPTGTFTWHWQVKANTNPVVTITLTADDSTTTTHQFSVHIGSATPNPAPKNPVAAAITAIGQTTTALAQAAAGAAQRLVRQIPVPVAYAFPYLLFAILGGGLLLLVWQTRTEIAEAEALSRALATDQTLGREKNTLTQLASHYLRTPLTVMSGGVEILSVKQLISPDQVQTLTAAITALHDKVEQLLGGVAGPGVEDPAAPAEPPHPRLRIWLRPGFWWPLLLIGGLTVLFNTLARRADRIVLTPTNSIVQLALFGLLALALYIALRSRTLRRRARQRTQHFLTAQADIDRSRNQLITNAATELGTDLAAIKTRLAALPPGQGCDLAYDGYHRFENVLAKFVTAARLETATALPAPQPFTLQSIVTPAAASIATAAQAKHLHVSLPADNPSLTIRRPDLLASVLASLLNNAVAYTPSGGTVTLTIQGGLTATTFTVTDTGPGLHQDKLNLLFRPFVRPDGALTFTHEGMGFSLYLDRLVMHYLGGDISATSQPGRGLSVTLSLPA